MTELLFQGRTPGHQLETEAIIDHREPARTQGDALAVNSCDVFTLRRWVIGEAAAGRNLRGRRVQFSSPQGIDQLSRKDNPLPLPTGKPLANEMLAPWLVS